MRKLVLAIIALVSVQFAFVTYMMVQRSPVDLTNAPVQAEPRPSNTDRVRIDDLNSLAEVMVDPTVEVPQIEPRNSKDAQSPARTPERPASRISPLRRVSKPAFKPTPSRTAAPVEFNSVVVRYDRSGAASDCERRELPKTKKRSFIAKAIPVIKKPWDWLKAIGSKFN